MGSEREQVARQISEQTAELARAARGVGLDTLAYVLDIAWLQANDVLKGEEPPPPEAV